MTLDAQEEPISQIYSLILTITQINIPPEQIHLH